MAFAESRAQPTTRRSQPLAGDAGAKSYRAFRRMHAANEKFNQEGWLECWTELDERGLPLRDRLRARLRLHPREGPEDAAPARAGADRRRQRRARADINDLNYEFADGASAPVATSGERTVELKPRRKDVLLVNGRMVLNEDGTELLRVEGRLSKNPSFWTNVVDIVREFARLDGVRVPISTDTVAKLKFAGTSRMDVRYNYESINGRPVSLEARQIATASLHPLSRICSTD